MPTPKFVDDKITYMLKTFDGSYVQGTMYRSEANLFLSNAEADHSVPGFELVNGPYRFETEEIVLKLNKKSKKETKDETDK